MPHRKFNQIYAELKERIENKIIVTKKHGKDGIGSSVLVTGSR